MGKLSFGTTGISYQPDKVELKVGGAPKCPRCQERVYFNEEKKALGKSWHDRCFTCAQCKKRMDSNNVNGHEGEIYCVRCHRKEFGPKGYGFAGGMAGLSTESTYTNVRPVSPLVTSTVADHIPSKSIRPDDPECCPRCGKKVYFAEELKAKGRKWHKLCFKCGSCNKMLEPGRCSEHQSGVYCRNCYVRDFGPSGYGVAGLSAELRPEVTRTRGTQPPKVNGHTRELSQSNTYTEEVPLPQEKAYHQQVSQPMHQPNGFTEEVPVSREKVYTQQSPAQPKAQPNGYTEEVPISREKVYTQQIPTQAKPQPNGFTEEVPMSREKVYTQQIPAQPKPNGYTEVVQVPREFNHVKEVIPPRSNGFTQELPTPRENGYHHEAAQPRVNTYTPEFPHPRENIHTKEVEGQARPTDFLFDAAYGRTSGGYSHDVPELTKSEIPQPHPRANGYSEEVPLPRANDFTKEMTQSLPRANGHGHPTDFMHEAAYTQAHGYNHGYPERQTSASAGRSHQWTDGVRI